MGKTKKLFLLAGWIALFLAACSTEQSDVSDPQEQNGKGKSADSDVAGADWRTTGLVFADGTITRIGEDTHVLVCVHKADAAFYYDDAVQTLYDRVEYPQAITDNPAEAFVNIDFADLDGDGNSDVRLLLEVKNQEKDFVEETAGGEKTSAEDGKSAERQPVQMTWLWDAGTREYVFCPEA